MHKYEWYKPTDNRLPNELTDTTNYLYPHSEAEFKLAVGMLIAGILLLLLSLYGFVTLLQS